MRRMAPTKKTAKKTERDRSGALYVLLEPAQLGELDGWIERLNEGNEGPQWTRTAVVRALISRGLRERGAKGEAP
mgnify:CR=1 FL=1